jgi:hypothetical protein
MAPSSIYLYISLRKEETKGYIRDACGPIHLAYNPSYSAYFFSRNSIFLSQKINQQCFPAGL